MCSRPRNFRTRLSNSTTSSCVVTLERESIGWRWRTVSNFSSGAAPTRWVGESGERVELRVGDGGVVEHVVAMVVMLDVPPELLDLPPDVDGSGARERGVSR